MFSPKLGSEGQAREDYLYQYRQYFRKYERHVDDIHGLKGNELTGYQTRLP
jgi:hypothetical protein